MANPLVNQGILLRARASVSITDYPSLNVTAPYTGKDGVSIAFENGSSLIIPTMTGTVVSLEPYQQVSVVMHLLRTQDLSALYKAQIELDSLLGEVVITPDATTLPSYTILNTAIMNVNELSMAGQDAGFVVTLSGYYPVNSSSFQS